MPKIPRIFLFRSLSVKYAVEYAEKERKKETHKWMNFHISMSKPIRELYICSVCSSVDMWYMFLLLLFCHILFIYFTWCLCFMVNRVTYTSHCNVWYVMFLFHLKWNGSGSTIAAKMCIGKTRFIITKMYKTENKSVNQNKFRYIFFANRPPPLLPHGLPSLGFDFGMVESWYLISTK